MDITKFAFALLAQAETQTSSNGTAGNEMMSWILMIVLIFFIMWFFMIRPQQNQQKKFDQMLSELKTGDKVVTIGGIKATVVNIIRDKNEIQLRLNDNVKVTFDMRAIAYVETPEDKK